MNIIKIKKALLLSALLLVSLLAHAAGCVQWAPTVFQPVADAEGQIAADSGIYWLKTDAQGSSEQAMPAYQPGVNRQQYLQQLKQKGLFDPNRPTIIFIHGWQPGSITDKQQTRFDFCYQFKNASGESSPRYNTLNKWQGWNVGVFYWNQYADEQNVLDAEAKIYSTDGAKQMRWAYIDAASHQQYCEVGQSNCIFPKIDIVQMAYQAYQQAFAGVAIMPKKPLRLAGQSLGTQIAIQLTDLIVHNPALPKPTRLALLDPYFSPNTSIDNKQHLPASVADYNAAKVADILETVKGFPISVYRTSQLSFAPTGDPAVKLMNQVAFMRLYPQFVYHDTAIYQGELHIASIYIYFMSMQQQPKWPLMAAHASGPSPIAYINAASPDWQVRSMMGQKRYQQSNVAEHFFPLTNLYQFSNKIPSKIKMLN